MMNAIIMAAGVGSRISRHVDKPKCLLEIEGKPLLRRTVDMLLRNHVSSVVVAGYQHQQIEQSICFILIQTCVNTVFRLTFSANMKKYLSRK